MPNSSIEQKGSGTSRRSRWARRALAAAVVLFCLAFVPAAMAGDGVWTSNGPDGGFVMDLAFDPSAEGKIWAATLSGVFVTDDAGESWAPMHGDAPNTLPQSIVYSVPVDPAGKVYAGTTYGNVYWSADGGMSWFAESSRPGDMRGNSTLVVDETPPYTTLYAGYFGVFRSDDGGDTWVEARGAFPNELPTGVILDLVVDDGMVYAGTSYQGVWKSEDAGLNWFPANGVSPLELPAPFIRAMTRDAAGTLYVATYRNGVWRTDDGGESWRPANGSPPHELPVVVLGQGFTGSALAADSAGALYLGGTSNVVYKGDAGGLSWSSVVLPVEPAIINAISADPHVTGRIAAGLDAGIARSDDAGAAWALKNDDLPAFSVFELYVDGGAPDTLFASGASGVAHSADGGDAWEDLTPGLPARWVMNLATCPTSATLPEPRLYATVSAWDRSLFRHDGGDGSFADCVTDATPFGAFGPSPYAVAADPGNPDRVFVTQSGSLTFDVPGLFLSEDGGASFTRVYAPSPASFTSYSPSRVAVDPLDPQRIYMESIGQSGPSGYLWHVVRSTDGGATFEEVLAGSELMWAEFALDANDPIEGDGASTVYIYSHTWSEAEPLTMRSRDGGATWSELSGVTGHAHRMRPDPGHGGTLYAYSNEGLAVSRDRGESWEAIPTDGIAADMMEGDFDVAATTPPTIHVGTVAGVYSYTTLGPQVAQPRDAGTGAQPASLSFGNVIASGETTLAMSGEGPEEPSGFKLGDPATYYNLETTAVFAGQVEVCITYDPRSFGSPEEELQLLHHEDGEWVDVTSSLDARNDTICGLTTSLSPFIIIEPDTDDDEVADAVDWCAGTAMPERAPTKGLGTNRWALMDADHAFDTKKLSNKSFTTADTGGCSCEQIIEEQGLGEGHRKHGCSTGEMREWSAIVHGG